MIERGAGPATKPGPARRAGEDRREQRLVGWRQTAAGRLPDAVAGAAFVQEAGVVTLFPVSPEVPNLFHAHTGDPDSRPETRWDSPAGRVYGWRWGIGQPAAACYTTFVLRRPTWVAWDLLPAVLRLREALQTPEELQAAGALSPGAARIARVLADCDGVLSTGVLRALAGYPTGKAERAAFLRAVAELDDRLLLAKVFAAEDEDMRHALIHVRYPEHLARAAALSLEEALEQLLLTYLPPAVFARPAALAKGLTLPPPVVHAALERLSAAGRAVRESLPGEGEPVYVWRTP